MNLITPKQKDTEKKVKEFANIIKNIIILVNLIHLY